MSSFTEEYLTVNDLRFYTRRWLPAPQTDRKAKLIFCHGFMEHIGRYTQWFDKLAADGYSIFAYDQRGFGKTGSESRSMGVASFPQLLNDLNFFIQAEAKYLPDKKLFLFGHSMGGLLALAYLTSPKTFPGLANLSGAIISAPLLDQAPKAKASPVVVRIGSLIGHLMPNFKMNVGVPSSDISRDPVVNKAYLEDPLVQPIATYRLLGDMLLGGAPILNQNYKHLEKELPLLMYHGTGDLVTSYDASQTFFNKIQSSDKTFKSYEGFYHEPHNEPGDDKWKVLQDVEDWLDARI